MYTEIVDPINKRKVKILSRRGSEILKKYYNKINGRVEFKKDNIVRYNKTGELVKIIGVHYDDPPNIYYTILMKNNNERQTVPEYLDFIRDFI